ncbi:MAG TPA: Co2+/Mg2+ efflux protein ApaG [Roseiarcus sp.]|jgi:ApaG protein
MYTAVTRNIKVTVEPVFSPERSDPDEPRFFWVYQIEIVNLGDRPVQLTHRHWRITDAEGRLEEVRGAGVVGEQPTLEPGRSFRYASGCPLRTPSGVMVGTYRMVTDDGEVFEVAIPAFSLDSPHDRRPMN